MARYLISFPGNAMSFPEEETPDVEPVMVAADGTVTAGTYRETTELSGGFTVVEVPSRDAALMWAAKIAAACRCAQEVREFQFDPLV